MNLEAGNLQTSAHDAPAGTAPEEQIADLRARIAQNPGNPALRNRLASLLQSEGRLDEAVGVLQDTIGRFPKNARAQDRLKILLAGSADRQLQEPEPLLASLLPALEATAPVATFPIVSEAPSQAGWSLVHEPRNMPIRLSRRWPTAEMIGSVSILLILGVVWAAWKVLPESHLLQKPAIIVLEAAIAPAASVVVATVSAPAPAIVQVEAADPGLARPAPAPPVAVAASVPTPLPLAMPQIVMILYDRDRAVPARKASHLAARLQAAHLTVGGRLGVAEAGRPGIGYFYAEDRAGAEALQRRLPDMAGSVRLISGKAREAQQPGALAIVIR